ncbi:Neutral alpha-glucosidase AB [Labeo rohita]|uniref:Neutral alpha-glucosidase AB n=1 Tax=Labeo rohita TaxID=84645 RepID=A0ABQ8MYX9_LABRO|nr:Neutral alpha-glucosidase AB [Labeo rohita]
MLGMVRKDKPELPSKLFVMKNRKTRSRPPIGDVSVYNAFVFRSEINKDWNSGKLSQRRIFLEQLGYKLVKPHIAKDGAFQEHQQLLQLL